MSEDLDDLEVGGDEGKVNGELPKGEEPKGDESKGEAFGATEMDCG